MLLLLENLYSIFYCKYLPEFQRIQLSLFTNIHLILFKWGWRNAENNSINNCFAPERVFNFNHIWASYFFLLFFFFYQGWPLQFPKRLCLASRNNFCFRKFSITIRVYKKKHANNFFHNFVLSFSDLNWDEISFNFRSRSSSDVHPLHWGSATVDNQTNLPIRRILLNYLVPIHNEPSSSYAGGSVRSDVDVRFCNMRPIFIDASVHLFALLFPLPSETGSQRRRSHHRRLDKSKRCLLSKKGNFSILCLLLLL